MGLVERDDFGFLVTLGIFHHLAGLEVEGSLRGLW